MSQMKRMDFSNELARLIASHGQELSDEAILDIVSTVVATYCVVKEVPEDLYMDYFENNYEVAIRAAGLVREEAIPILYGPPGEA